MDVQQGRNRGNPDMARPGGTYDAITAGQDAVNAAWLAHRRRMRRLR